MAKGSMGMEENVAGLLSYVFGWVTGLIFFFVEKESKFVKFHAMQAILLSLPASIIGMVTTPLPFIFRSIGGLIGLVAYIIGIVCMIKAYKMEEFKLPIIGDIAAKIVNKQQ